MRNHRQRLGQCALPPFSPVVLKSDLRRVAHEFSERFDRASFAVVPVTRKQAMSESVTTGIAGIVFLHRMLIPSQLLLQIENPRFPCWFIPRVTLRIGEHGIIEFGCLQSRLNQIGYFAANRNLVNLVRFGGINPPQHATRSDFHIAHF